MMDREQTINKIMEEYSKFGVVRNMAEQVYDSAIQMNVPKETIYPGMKMILNNTLGLDNAKVVNEVGEKFTENAVNETKKANPTATDDVIAKNFKEELEDDFDWNALKISEDIRNSIKNSTEKFIKSNELSK